jgi:two-component system, chemotaxis family, chemotaxis protein CheY
MSESTPSTKILIVEDDYTSRTLLQKYLKDIAQCEIATNGLDGVQAFSAATQAGEPFDIILLDIMMPGMNGQDALRQIRAMEKDRGVKPSQMVTIIMTTALDSLATVRESYYDLCDGYVVKPVTRDKLFTELKKHGFDLSAD